MLHTRDVWRETHLMICVILDCYICAKSLLVYMYAAVYVCEFLRLPS
jgi:hypothetical protein